MMVDILNTAKEENSVLRSEWKNNYLDFQLKVSPPSLPAETHTKTGMKGKQQFEAIQTSANFQISSSKGPEFQT